MPSPGIFVPSRKIKGIAGDLVPYVLVPSECRAEEHQESAKKLFHFLGLTTELNMPALLSLLTLAQERPVDDTLRKQLSRVYRELGKVLEEEENPSIQSARLLCDDGIFRAAPLLYWNNDPELGLHFGGLEGISFVWAPPDVETRRLETFFKAAGVKPLSESIERNLITPTEAKLAGDLSTSVRVRARYIYSILRHHQAARSELGKRFASLNIKLTDSLDLLISLSDYRRTIAVPVFYDIAIGPDS